MQARFSVWRYFDYWLATAVVLLSAYGVLVIRSAITGEPNFVGYDFRQAIFLVLGIVVMLTVASVDYRYLTSAQWLVYGVFLFSLILVLLLGTINNAALRWIPLGPIQIQPSELGRTFLTVSFAQFLAERQRRIKEFGNTVTTIAYFGVPILLIFIQPDLGMSILYVVMWFIIIVMAGLPLSHFLILAAVGIIGTGAAFPFLQDYQVNRITTFIDPSSDPEQAFNVDQALISIGSGGWWGKGYMQGTQSQLGFLRVQHTDFIFSMLTEEMGFFFGSAIVMGLLTFILFRILRIASITPDPAGRFYLYRHRRFPIFPNCSFGGDERALCCRLPA